MNKTIIRSATEYFPAWTKEELDAMDKRHRWNTIRKYYIKAMAATDRNQRENYKKICRENLAVYDKMYLGVR